MIDTALIYAAGLGKRMGELTRHGPKALLPYQGRAIIDHGIRMLSAGGIREIHVNSFHLAPLLAEHFAGTNVDLHEEHVAPYETGGTLKSLASVLPNQIFTLNADVIFEGDNPLQKMRDSWSEEFDALLLLVHRDVAQGHAGRGDFFYDTQGLRRKKIGESAPYIYSGLQIIRPHRACEFSGQVFSNLVIWDKLLEEGRIGAMVYDGKWFDLGTKDAYLSALGNGQI